jgi:hypothetical protein
LVLSPACSSEDIFRDSVNSNVWRMNTNYTASLSFCDFLQLPLTADSLGSNFYKHPTIYYLLLLYKFFTAGL